MDITLSFIVLAGIMCPFFLFEAILGRQRSLSDVFCIYLMFFVSIAFYRYISNSLDAF